MPSAVQHAGAGRLPVPSSDGDAAGDAELRARLKQLKDASGLSYDKLAAAAAMSRGAVLDQAGRAHVSGCPVC